MISKYVSVLFACWLYIFIICSMMCVSYVGACGRCFFVRMCLRSLLYCVGRISFVCCCPYSNHNSILQWGWGCNIVVLFKYMYVFNMYLSCFLFVKSVFRVRVREGLGYFLLFRHKRHHQYIFVYSIRFRPHFRIASSHVCVFVFHSGTLHLSDLNGFDPYKHIEIL